MSSNDNEEKREYKSALDEEGSITKTLSNFSDETLDKFAEAFANRVRNEMRHGHLNEYKKRKSDPVVTEKFHSLLIKFKDIIDEMLNDGFSRQAVCYRFSKGLTRGDNEYPLKVPLHQLTLFIKKELPHHIKPPRKRR